MDRLAPSRILTVHDAVFSVIQWVGGVVELYDDINYLPCQILILGLLVFVQWYCDMNGVHWALRALSSFHVIIHVVKHIYIPTKKTQLLDHKRLGTE